MERMKDFRQMTAQEREALAVELKDFERRGLVRLQRLQQEHRAWTQDDRRTMEQGLRLIGTMQFGRDFVEKALRYGDYAARAGRLPIYIDKVRAVLIGEGLMDDPNQPVVRKRPGRPAKQETIARREAEAVAARQQQGLFENTDPTPAPPLQGRGVDGALPAGGTAGTGAVGAQMMPTLSAVTAVGEQEYRLHLDQKAPFLSRELQEQVASVRTLRGVMADSSNTAKLLAEQGKPSDEIEPYSRKASEAADELGKIYEAIDTELATVYYRLQNDGDYRDGWLKRFGIKGMDEVSKDLLYDMRKHLAKVDCPEFQLRMKTLIEQESPEYVARMKAEAERKKEVSDILRYLRRKDKGPSEQRVETSKAKYRRLVELLGKKEALAYKPLVTAIEEEYKKMKDEKAEAEA